MKKVRYILISLIVISGIIFIFSSHIANKQISAPTGLKIPALSCTDNSVWLIWDRPKDDTDIAYYNIYVDDKIAGNTKMPQPAIGTQHIQKFQNENKELSGKLLSFHTFKAENLQPDTDYTFTVRAVDTNGKESANSIAIKQHTLPNVKNIISLTDFGAVGDGTTINTAALQKAIDSCPPSGILEIPKGIFVTGAVSLKSDMTLQLDKGAVLLGSKNAGDYAKDNDHYMGMLNADNISNVRIIGNGTIDGSGWQKDTADQYYLKADNKISDGILNNNNVLNIGILAKEQTQSMLDNGDNFKNAYSKRSSTLIFHNVNNLYLEGITLLNPSMHMIVANNCNNMTLNNIKVMTYDCNNGDGIDFSGTNLLVVNSYFDTGDDCINFSAGMGLKDSDKPPTSDIYVFNNYFAHGHGAVVCGSHTGSWIQNILAEDNVMEQTETGLRCKTGKSIGGGARNIVFRNNVMKSLQQQGFIFTTAYTDQNAVINFQPAEAGQFHDITIENCNIDGTGGPAIEVDGLPEMPHKNITFRNVHFINTQPNKISHLENGIFDNVTYTAAD